MPSHTERPYCDTLTFSIDERRWKQCIKKAVIPKAKPSVIIKKQEYSLESLHQGICDASHAKP